MEEELKVLKTISIEVLEDGSFEVNAKKEGKNMDVYELERDLYNVCQSLHDNRIISTALNALKQEQSTEQNKED
ncbi:hypothetical protein KLEB273_gp051 [Bacillus phage vB_BauM_KLEB27-3]|nr:hypothetical protein KLEB273_gp051 [Bacillus phage vB_BauM_KLEB27-3]